MPAFLRIIAVVDRRVSSQEVFPFGKKPAACITVWAVLAVSVCGPLAGG